MNALRQVSSPMFLVPAYGRTYDSIEDMRAAWEAEADFRIVGNGGGGRYCSIRDIHALINGSSSVTLVCPTTNLSVKVA